MFCTSCGTRNVVDSNFCKQCGTRLERPTATKIQPEDFDRALPDEEQVSALIERAYLHRKEGDLEGAISLCIEALHLPIESTSAHSLLGQLYEEKGDHEAAIREYERVLALNPGSIADRVKLDELRNGGKFSPQQHTSKDGSLHAPRVVLSDDRRNRVFDLDRFTAVSVPLVLVLLGSAITLLWMQHNGTNVPVNGTNGANNAQGTSMQTAGGGMSTDQTGLHSKAGPADGTRASGAPANGANSMIASNAGTRTNQASNLNYPTFNPQANPQLNSQRQGFVPTPPVASDRNAGFAAPDRTSKSRPRTTAPDTGNVPSDSRGDGGDTHIRIPVDGDDSKGTGETPVIKFDVVKPASNGSGGATAGGAGAGSNNASSEAISMIGIGQEKKLQKDYKAAIDAFTKALGSAGNQKGYVLQQRAFCFQQLSDQTSAHNDYASAIDEYRKLETSDKETALNGIRACERGMKLGGN